MLSFVLPSMRGVFLPAPYLLVLSTAGLLLMSAGREDDFVRPRFFS